MLANEPEWLTDYRKLALECFEKLPLEKSRYTQIDLDFNKIRMNIGTEMTDMPKKFEKLIKDEENIIIQVNNRIVHIHTPKELQEKGIIIEGLNDALEYHPSLLRDFFEKRAIKPDESKLVAFNCAFLSSGIFVYVPENTEIEKPIHYIFVASDNATTVSQILIHVGQNSRLAFIDEAFSEHANAFYSSIFEVHLKENAKIDYISLQNLDENTINMANKRALVERDGKINWIAGRIGSKLDKSQRDTFLVGQGASMDDTEVFFGRNSQHFDITSNVFHKVPHTKGNILIKGILRDKARSVSQGMIKIDKNAQRTDSLLSEHMLMLDKGARSDAIPGLEIEADDVRATHSASVSRIDDEQIFYMASRGIEEDDAKKLIALGFIDSAMQKLDNKMKKKISGMIKKKWNNVAQ